MMKMVVFSMLFDGFAKLGPIQLSDDMFVQDAIELLGVAVASAARRLSSAGQVIVDYIATVALGAAPWRENFSGFSFHPIADFTLI